MFAKHILACLCSQRSEDRHGESGDDHGGDDAGRDTRERPFVPFGFLLLIITYQGHKYQDLQVLILMPYFTF